LPTPSCELFIVEAGRDIIRGCYENTVLLRAFDSRHEHGGCPGARQPAEARPARRQVQAVDIRAIDSRAEDYDRSLACGRPRRLDNRALQRTSAQPRDGRPRAKI